jgi:hypothetical protein
LYAKRTEQYEEDAGMDIDELTGQDARSHEWQVDDDEPQYTFNCK